MWYKFLSSSWVKEVYYEAVDCDEFINDFCFIFLLEVNKFVWSIIKWGNFINYSITWYFYKFRICFEVNHMGGRITRALYKNERMHSLRQPNKTNEIQ